MKTVLNEKTKQNENKQTKTKQVKISCKIKTYVRRYQSGVIRCSSLIRNWLGTFNTMSNFCDKSEIKFELIQYDTHADVILLRIIVYVQLCYSVVEAWWVHS